MKATTIGFDLAKNVFQVHGVDAAGKAVVRKKLSRAQVLPFFARLAPCTIGIEACGSAHHWARKFTELGHTAKLMAPHFVKPYVKANKTDAADAEAICEAVARPNMRFVPVKSVEQQAILAVHRVRSGLVAERTAQLNRLRALLAEFGLIAPRGRRALMERLPVLFADETLPGVVRTLFERQSTRIRQLDAEIAAEEAVIMDWHRNNELSKRIDAVAGVGPITATALVASFGEAREFDNGRQMAATGEVVLEFDHDAEHLIPTRPRGKIAGTFEKHDDRIIEPRVDERAKQIAYVVICPFPRHGRLVAVAAMFRRAIHHHGGVHSDSVPRLCKASPLEEDRGADSARGEDHGWGIECDRRTFDPGTHADRFSVFNDHRVHSCLGNELTPSGGNRLVGPFGGVPLCPAPATQHALRAAVEAIGSGWVHKFEKGSPGVTERVSGVSDVGGGRAPEFGGQGGDVEFSQRFVDVSIEIDSVSFLEPVGWSRGASAIHACRAAGHQGANDVEAFTGKEKGRAVGVEERAGVGAVQGRAPPIFAALEEDDFFSSASEATSHRRAARP